MKGEVCMLLQDFTLVNEYSPDICREVKDLWGESDEYGCALIGSPRLLVCIQIRMDIAHDEANRNLEGEILPGEEVDFDDDVMNARLMERAKYYRQISRLRQSVYDEVITALACFEPSFLAALLKDAYGS